jgi:hypothetical protein
LARAKRTDRTEARRRYRAEQAAELETSQDGDELVHDAETPAPARRKGAAPASAAAASSSAPAAGARPVRPSFIGSARAAYRAPNVREDLPHLPRLLIHWSVLVSAAIAIVGTGLLTIGGVTTDATGAQVLTSTGQVGQLLNSLFVGPPAFGAALLIGFMVPRATYLVGLVYGIFASLCLSVFILSQPSDKLTGLGPETIAYAFLIGILGTMFFTAGIAWYKRFLDLLNPNRGQRAKSQPKPPQGRGNAPRNRLSGSSR